MEKLSGKPYDGPSGIARDSQWLTSEDLIQGKETKVKIEKVMRYDNVKFKGGKGPDQNRPVVISLRFVGKERELGINRTNTKIMNKMFGNITKNWVGKEISLYVTQCLAFGETVDCVRIKDTGARVATAGEQFLADTPEEDPKATPGDAAEPPEDGSALFPPASH